MELRHWIPKGPHMNSETKWNGILIHILLWHWNIYIGCYKSTWQILETTWKPQEIFYPGLIVYGNSWWQEKKKKEEEEFGVQNKWAVSFNMVRILLLEACELLFCRWYSLATIWTKQKTFSNVHWKSNCSAENGTTMITHVTLSLTPH